MCFISSTSPSGGNQVDGLPPASRYEKSTKIEIRTIHIYEILSRNSILIIWRPENQQISEIFKITKIKIYQNFIHGVTSNRNSEIHENFTQIELRSIYKYESWSRNSILMIPRLSNQQISRIFKITKNQIYQNFTHGVTANRNSRI